MKLFSWLMVIVVLGLMYWFYDQNALMFQRNVRFVYNIGLRDQLDFNTSVQGVLLFGACLGFILGLLAISRPYHGLRRKVADRNEEIQVLQRQLRQATLSACSQLESGPRAALPELESSTEEFAQDEDAATTASDPKENK